MTIASDSLSDMELAEQHDLVEVMPSTSTVQVLTVEGKMACGAHKKSGEPCKMPAGFGTDHLGYGACKFHGGSMKTSNVRAARQQANEIIEAKIRSGDASPEDDPEEVLMQEVSRANAAVLHFDDLVKSLADDEMTTNHGRTLVNQWNEQRRLLTTVSKIVLQSGIAERQTRVLEVQAMRVLEVIDAALASAEADLSPRQVATIRRMIAAGFRDTVQPTQHAELQTVING